MFYEILFVGKCDMFFQFYSFCTLEEYLKSSFKVSLYISNKFLSTHKNEPKAKERETVHLKH